MINEFAEAWRTSRSKMIESNRPHLHLVSVCRLNQTVKVQISLHDSCTLNPIDIPSESELIHAENSKPEAEALPAPSDAGAPAQAQAVSAATIHALNEGRPTAKQETAEPGPGSSGIPSGHVPLKQASLPAVSPAVNPVPEVETSPLQVTPSPRGRSLLLHTWGD